PPSGLSGSRSWTAGRAEGLLPRPDLQRKSHQRVVVVLDAPELVGALHLAVDVAQRGLHRPFAEADAELGVADQGRGLVSGPAGPVPAVVAVQHVEAHGPAAGRGEQVPTPAVAEGR